MIIVCAPDSYIESMSAQAACAAMRTGILSVWPDAEVLLFPMADGGEGTAQTLTDAVGGAMIPVATQNANGEPTTGYIGHLASQEAAVIEVATACGLEQIPVAERDPGAASTFGVAALVQAALNLGVEKLIFTLGGTATNDAGSGLLSGLGVRFLDKRGHQLPPGGLALASLTEVDVSGLDLRLAYTQVLVVSDVRNPLLGATGASHVFGPQKGADPHTVELLDRALTNWADRVTQALGTNFRNTPGAGAAGGLGAALMTFLGAQIEPGAQFVMRTVGLDKAIEAADLVFTGEGSFDTQSLSGKVPYTVAQFAAEQHKAAFTFVGSVTPEMDDSAPQCFSAVIPIGRTVTNLDSALAAAPKNLERAVRMVCQTLQVGSRQLT